MDRNTAVIADLLGDLASGGQNPDRDVQEHLRELVSAARSGRTAQARQMLEELLMPDPPKAASGPSGTRPTSTVLTLLRPLLDGLAWADIGALDLDTRQGKDAMSMHESEPGPWILPPGTVEGGTAGDMESPDLAQLAQLVQTSGKRILGLDRDKLIYMSEDFNDPLPDEFWLGTS